MAAGVGAANRASNPMGAAFDAYDVGDTLTANDKALVGWDPSSGKINTAANALAGYRHSGALTTEVTKDFVDAIKTSIAKSGGYPVSPPL